MIFEILRWWYVTGWLQAMHRIIGWTQGVEQLFSVSLLAKTLFSPWRRIVTPPGRGLDAKMRAMLDNLVSRCVGFVIRLFVIFAAGVSMLVVFTSSAVLAIVWPLLPLAFVFFAVKGITG
jgi:hypothetical protein